MPELQMEPTSGVDLGPALERLARWEREGTLDHLERALKALTVVIDMLTPEIVEGAVRQLAGALELADRVAHSEVLPVVDVLNDVQTLLREPVQVHRHELRHLWHELHDRDALSGLELALGLLKLAGQRTALAHQGGEQDG